MRKYSPILTWLVVGLLVTASVVTVACTVDNPEPGAWPPGADTDVPSPPTPAEDEDAYFVSTDGSDAADGRSPASAWKTISKVNGAYFEPGAVVYFRRGDTWREQLTVPSPGRDGAPIGFAAFGQGPQPRIAGTLPVTPVRNAVRNPGFEDVVGSIDDGISDDFLHYYTSGGRVEAVSDTAGGDSTTAVRLTRDGSRASLFFYAYLPADTVVTLTWAAKSLTHDGAVAVRHQLMGAQQRYLQADRQTWSDTPEWNACPIAGTTAGTWTDRRMDFRTDAAAGAYEVYFMSANTVDGDDTSFIDDVVVTVEWEPYAGATYRIGTGYPPRRVLLRSGGDWVAALNAADFGRNRDDLQDRQWVYDADNGFVYFRDDFGDPGSSGIEMELSVPENGSNGECGIYIDQSYVTVRDLAVVGWPDDTPAFSYAGGIAITESVRHVTIADCTVAFNYYLGLYTRASDSGYTGNRFAYNGGNGFLMNRSASNNIVAHNIAEYNGYWGDPATDGEGIALGEAAEHNLVEFNDIHHNNRHPDSWNPGGLVIYHSNHNVVRYNRVYANYKAGAVVDGVGNAFYYNLVYANGIGYADTTSSFTCNLLLRNWSPDGAGGNKIFNNVFYGGSADVGWMGNLFVNRDCTDTEVRNNVFWNFSNSGGNDVQIRVDGGIDLTGTVFSNNVVGPQGDGFIHFGGQNFDALVDFQQQTGQGTGSLVEAPAFSDPAVGNFRPKPQSVTIDAGIDVGLSEDFIGNPLDRRPDIGAFEYPQ